MRPTLTRRQCLALIPLTGAAIALHAAGAQPEPHAPAPAPPDAFPQQDPALAREIVGASHGKLDRVTALLKDAPQLANAAYDWGFGDWETALGAASHTGRRQIAALLLDHGARPDIFTCAMLGHLDAVMAMIAASPGLQRTRGPHGLTLLHHARAGGDPSKPVAEYLATLGDADVPYPEQPLAPDQRDLYKGTYTYGQREDQRFQILIPEKQDRLAIQRGAAFPRALFHLGNHAFHPTGAPDVRIQFTIAAAQAAAATITTPASLLTATRA